MTSWMASRPGWPGRGGAPGPRPPAAAAPSAATTPRPSVLGGAARGPRRSFCPVTPSPPAARGGATYRPPALLAHPGRLRFAMTAQRLGASVVVMGLFNAAAALDALEAPRVTHSFWVPTMFVRLLQLPADDRNGRNLGAHRVALHSGA